MSNIVNTYFKVNFVQYIFILFLICGTIIKKNSTHLNVVKKHDTIYRTMYNHYEISKFVKNIIKKCKINHYHISHKYDISHFILNDKIFEKMEYIYFFRSKNLLVYFFKKINENNHKVYFEGVDEMGDLQYLSFPNKWFDEYTLKSVRKNLSETGFLFQITKDNVLRIKNEAHSIFHFFSYLNNTLYHNLKNIDDSLQSSKFHTKIEIEGYSMGGVLSQVFIYILLSNKYIQKYKLNIDLYIIESWWGGNKDFYEYLSSYIKIHNVMCVGSILYYYNIFFQKYFKIKKYVSFPIKPLFQKYIQMPFPFGVSEYFGDHHYISRFIKYVKK
jgi:hypothetical protein